MEQVQIPSDWHAALVARMVRNDPGLVVQLRLSYNPRYFPGRLHAAGTDVGELERELQTIVSFKRLRPSSQFPDTAYDIRTPRLWLRVCNRTYDAVGVAQIVDAGRQEAESSAPVSPFLRGGLGSIYDLVPFDLGSAYADFGRAKQAAESRARAAARGTRPPSRDKPRLAELDRKLLCAEAITALVDTRETIAATIRVGGVVVAEAGEPGVPGVVRVRFEAASGAFVEDSDVALESAAGSVPAEIAKATGDEVLVRLKRSADLHRFEPGGAVTVVHREKTKPDTAVHRAIGRLRKGDVAGDRRSLVDLLVAPEALPAAEALGDEQLDPRLSEEQEQVVRRALNAPHAFFIQGPPGTGKTTVIAEIIRQLAARGERVLLAAPMHVAVDEVLRRLKDDPRIWAMRVASEPKNIGAGLEYLHELALSTDAARLTSGQDHVRDGWIEEEEGLVRWAAALDRLIVATDANTEAHDAFGRLRAKNRPGRFAWQISVAEAELAALAPRLAAAIRDQTVAERSTAQAALLAPDLTAAEADMQEAAERLAELGRRSQARQALLDEAGLAARAAAGRLQTAEQEISALEGAVAQTQTLVEKLQAQLTHEWGILTSLATKVAEYATWLHRARGAEQQAAAAFDAAYARTGLGTHIASSLSRGRIAGEQRLLQDCRRELKQVGTAYARSEQAAAAQQVRALLASGQLATTRSDLARLERSLTGWRESRGALIEQASSARTAQGEHQEQLAATASACNEQRAAHNELVDIVGTLREHQRATRTAYQNATAVRAGLEAARTELDETLAKAGRQLAKEAARLEAAAGEADSRRRDLAEARSAAEACGGALPDDPSAERAVARARSDRLRTLLRLSARWRELLGPAEADQVRSAEELSGALRDATNLVCSTVLGIHGSPSAGRAHFDTLILDEASRVVDTDLLVPAVRARRWILVGDERQLPPYVDQEAEQHVHALLALRAMEKAAHGSTDPVGTGVNATGFDFAALKTAVTDVAATRARLLPDRPIRGESTLDLAAALVADGSWQANYRGNLDTVLARLGTDLSARGAGSGSADIETMLLDALATGRSTSRFENCVKLRATAGVTGRLTVQRRMVEPIAELVNKPVYNNAYHSPSPADLAEQHILPFTGAGYPQPVVFFDTRRAPKARSVGTGFVNDREADIVINLLHIWDRIAGQSGPRSEQLTFSVLSFYKAQAALIERRLDQRPPLKWLRCNVIDSIDKIQGQESHLVVISFVRARQTDNRPAQNPTPGKIMWLQDIHRLNVAVTRARLALALVGDRQTLAQLKGNKDAEVFYKNLFDRLDSGKPGMSLIVDTS